MIFADPKYLVAFGTLPLILLLILLVAVRKRRVLARMGEPGLLADLARSRSGDRAAIKRALVLAALACALLSAARPQAGWQLTRGTAKGIDMIVALDVSASMLAEDVKPSRLARAKSELAALISAMRGSRVGVIAFAGSAVPVCPMTSDSRAAMMFLDALHWGAVEDPGTDLGKAIERALSSFDLKEDRSRAVVIVSDGEDHEGGFTPATERAVQAGVPVYCVGVGGDAGAPIPLDPGGSKSGFRKDSNGEIVLTKLDRRVLEDVAQRTHGSVYTLGPARGSLGDLAADLKKLPTKERPTTYTHRDEKFHIAALVALCLLALDWFVGERRRVSVGVAAVVAFAAVLGAASPVKAAGAAAVKLYSKGDYAAALAKFREKLESDPSPALYYDAGNSLYRLGKYDEAVRDYTGSLNGKEPSLKAHARYNMGNCLFRSGDIRGAVDQYVEALKIDPKDEDAKHNLELALRKLKKSAAKPRAGRQDEKDKTDRSGRGESQGSGEKKSGRSGEKTAGEHGDRAGRGQAGTPQGAEPGRSAAADSAEAGQGRRVTRFTPKEAKRLLEALAGDEKKIIGKRMKSKVRRKGVKKNW